MTEEAEIEAIVDRAIEVLTPESFRELVRFSVEIGIAAIVAGAGEDEPIPDFILRQAGELERFRKRAKRNRR